MPEQLEFPKLIIVTPYPRPGFPADDFPSLCVDTVQSFSLITDDGDAIAVLSIWHDPDVAYARLWDARDKPSYEVGISKELLMIDKSALERATIDMLLRCGMRFSL